MKNSTHTRTFAAGFKVNSMCMLCVEIQKERMSLNEVNRAVGEMVVPEDHRDELSKVIVEKFNEESGSNYQGIIESLRRLDSGGVQR